MLRECEQLDLVVCLLCLLRLVPDKFRDEILQPVVACSSRKNQQSENCCLAWLQLQDLWHELVHADRTVFYRCVVSEGQLGKIASPVVNLRLRIGDLILDLCQIQCFEGNLLSSFDVDDLSWLGLLRIKSIGQNSSVDIIFGGLPLKLHSAEIFGHPCICEFRLCDLHLEDELEGPALLDSLFGVEADSLQQIDACGLRVLEVLDDQIRLLEFVRY